MRRDVRKVVSWIEEFERKANSEIDKIIKVDAKISTEISDLQTKITDLNDNLKVLGTSKTKINNLLKAITGE